MLDFASLNQKDRIIVGLTAATAVLHLLLAFGSLGDTLFFVIFLLNGLGYLGLLAALYFDIPMLKPYKALARPALIGFASLTIVLYFAFNWPDVWNPVGILDKLIEAALVVMLLRR
jgi:hypothetical protein